MNWDTLLALTGFVAVMIGTPGPANASAMASGAAVGFVRSLPFLAGVWLGFIGVIFAVAGGVGSLLLASSTAHVILKILGFGYICYLAWRIWQMPVGAPTEPTAHHFGFKEGLFLHPLNPKAYVMLLVVISSFVTPGQDLFWQIMIIVLVTLLTGVDAFADGVFGGNPAAVVPLESWLPDDLMLSIAAENNLAETAYFVPVGDGYELRWFTPTAEVPLCGHATLASAHVLFAHLGFDGEEIVFQTKSGPLTVVREGDLYAMDFPADMPKPTMVPEQISEVLGVRPSMVLSGHHMLAVFEDMRQVMTRQAGTARRVSLRRMWAFRKIL
eukprot:s1_g2339.t1